MRPDEHKKRKNEQYKKKHGIKSGKGSIDEKNKDSKDQKKRIDVSSTGVAKEMQQELLNERPVDEEKPRTFQRRKVESNWDRYTEDPASQLEPQEHRGADFKEILAGSCTAISQFRFKDEQGWEEGQGQSSVSDLVSLDCDDVMRAISCVPLNERLHIDPSHFQEMHLNKFKEQAAFNKENYKKNHVEREISKTRETAESLANQENKETSSKAPRNNHCKVHDETSGETAISRETDSNHRICRDELDDMLDSGDEYKLQDYSTDVTLQADHDKPGGMQETAELLETSSTVESNVKLNVQNPNILTSTASHTTSENLEDDLDKLLCFDEDVKPKQYTSDTKPAATVQATGQTESLEDWLDSVLDD